MGYPLVTFTAGDKVEAASQNTNLKKARDTRFELQANEAINTTSVPKPFYIASNGWIGVCDANVQTKLEFVGFVLFNQNVAAGEFVEVMMGEGTIVPDFAGLTKGSKYYVQDDQSIGTALGTYEVQVGIAVNATEIVIAKGSFEYMGSVSITQSTGTTSQWIGSGTVLALARFVIVDWSCSANPNAHSGQGLMIRNGLSGVTAGRDPLGATALATGGASWNTGTNVITVQIDSNTQNSSWSGGGTAYMYR